MLLANIARNNNMADYCPSPCSALASACVGLFRATRIADGNQPVRDVV